MARTRKLADGESNQYKNEVTGETVGAFAGSELDRVYAKDPDYTVVGNHTPPPEKIGVAEATPHSGKTKSEGARTHPSDLEGLSREELNALALEKGVTNPDGFANKDEVRTAIIQATPGVAEGE
jgi:hypothetical protein